MLTMSYQLGAAANQNALRPNSHGETTSAGERLDRYPWERAAKAAQITAALQAQDRSSPIPIGPALLGRGRAQKAEMLMQLSRRGGDDPAKVAYASVRDMLVWMRTGNPDVDMRRVVQDRIARARSIEGTVITPGAPTALDFYATRTRGVIAAGLRIFGGR
jgi:hypothetical protein